MSRVLEQVSDVQGTAAGELVLDGTAHALTTTVDVSAFNVSGRFQGVSVPLQITGGRLHPSWFRLGGVREDLPEGWKEAVEGTGTGRDTALCGGLSRLPLGCVRRKGKDKERDSLSPPWHL
jgi:hypothetical protein